MDARHERIAKNEAMYRSVNRELQHASEEFGDGPEDELEVLCECGQEDCGATFALTIADYDAVHKERDRFVVARGHDDPEIERVVREADVYVVVDKFGEAGRIAENSS